MGCNGDCYQGRWCDCKTEESIRSERKCAYSLGVLIVILAGVTAWLLV